VNSEWYFTRLETIYKHLEELLEPARRDCGKCCICCLNMKGDAFSLLEAAYIYKHLGKKEITPGETLLLLKENRICPFCDLARGRCGIYLWRPLTCRLHGPFVEEPSSYIFKDCVYSSNTCIYPGERKNILPFYKEYVSLNKGYLKAFPEGEKKQPGKGTEDTIRKNIESFKKALEISFHKGPILTLLGRAHGNIEDFQKADFYYKEAIEEDPHYDFTYYLKGLNHYARGNFNEAEKELKKGLAINPKNINMRSFLIMLYINTRKDTEARKEIEYLSGLYPFILERYPFLKEISNR
jgi:tetratricopeptide (TPR) repeat protein